MPTISLFYGIIVQVMLVLRQWADLHNKMTKGKSKAQLRWRAA